MTYLASNLPTRPIASGSDKSVEKNGNTSSEHEFVLSKREAEAAAVYGEEDPGEGLEFLAADESEK